MALQDRLKAFDSEHQLPINRLCHTFGILLTTLAVFGLFSLQTYGPIPIPGLMNTPWLELDISVFLWLSALIFTLFQDWKLTLPYGLFIAGIYFLARAMPLPILILSLAGGIALPIVGHRSLEKNSPHWKHELSHLYFGPLWVFTRLIGFSFSADETD